MEAEAQTPPRQSYFATLKTNERHWIPKLTLRAITVIIGIIGIGCVAWSVVDSTSSLFFADYSWALPWGLITFPLSIIWNLVCILVLLLRKKPAHPGIAVGLDLVLWLSFIVTGLFCFSAAYDALYFGEGGYISSSYINGGSYSGDYEYFASNNTWVWQPSSSSYAPSRRSCYEFTSCAEQDAYVNQLWRERPHRAGVEMTGAVTQFLAVLLHFTLFVWACVDTAHRNRNKTGKQAQIIAEKIIQDMTARGQIVPMQQQSHQPLLAPGAQGEHGVQTPQRVATPPTTQRGREPQRYESVPQHEEHDAIRPVHAQ